MVSLYHREEAQRLARSGRRARYAAWGLLAACFAVCALLCGRVRTGNAQRLLGLVIAVSTAGGWAAILLLRLRSRPCRIVAAHMEGLLNNPEEAFSTGEISLRPGVVSIPGSIDIRKAELHGSGEPTVLNVLAEKAGELPPDGTRVRLRTVRGYIMGWEAVP